MKTQRLAMGVHYSTFVAALAAVALSNTGCATMTNGSTQAVSVSTNPAHATVETGGRILESPCVIELARKHDHTITISKPGYRTESVQIGRKLTGAVFGNILIGGLIGAGVDAATGANNELVPGHIDLALTPDGTPADRPIATAPQGQVLTVGR